MTGWKLPRRVGVVGRLEGAGSQQHAWGVRRRVVRRVALKVGRAPLLRMATTVTMTLVVAVVQAAAMGARQAARRPVRLSRLLPAFPRLA